MKNYSGGFYLGICDILFLIFLVLKLTGNIDWSWWWVTSPLWIGFILGIFLLILYYIIIKVIFK